VDEAGHNLLGFFTDLNKRLPFLQFSLY